MHLPKPCLTQNRDPGGVFRLLELYQNICTTITCIGHSIKGNLFVRFYHHAVLSLIGSMIFTSRYGQSTMFHRHDRYYRRRCQNHFNRHVTVHRTYGISTVRTQRNLFISSHLLDYNGFLIYSGKIRTTHLKTISPSRFHFAGIIGHSIHYRINSNFRVLDKGNLIRFIFISSDIISPSTQTRISPKVK